MRDQRALFVAGAALMPLAFVLNRSAHLPDFFSGLVFGVGMGLLILFVWRISGDKRERA